MVFDDICVDVTLALSAMRRAIFAAFVLVLSALAHLHQRCPFGHWPGDGHRTAGNGRRRAECGGPKPESGGRNPSTEKGYWHLSLRLDWPHFLVHSVGALALGTSEEIERADQESEHM
jgi:hypothetical protein